MVDIVHFFFQYSSCGSSSRGVQSGGRVLTFNDILDKEYFKSLCKGRYKVMYSVNRSELVPITSMRLDEFEKIFWREIQNNQINHLLGLEEGTQCIFRKEINERYGVLSKKPKDSFTTKYERGQVVSTLKNKYIYLGYFQGLVVKVDGNVLNDGNVLRDGYGHVYMPYSIIERVSDLHKEDLCEKALCRFFESLIFDFRFWKECIISTKKRVLVPRIESLWEKEELLTIGGHTLSQKIMNSYVSVYYGKNGTYHYTISEEGDCGLGK